MDIAEGKTKIIRASKRPNEVLIVTKDDITAGDGARRHRIRGKGRLATATTVNVFKLLKRHGLPPTHFVRRLNATTFLARKCRMIPVEVVVRRVAYGSYCRRRPDVPAGTRLPSLAVEFFLKDDARHDPLMLFSEARNMWEAHDAKQPVGAAPLGVVPDGRLDFGTCRLDRALASRMNGAAQMAFETLEEAWKRQDVMLVDLKVEFGIEEETGVPVIADVIDNDSWRIWPQGDPAKMLDKQVYRNLTVVTEEALRDILANYADVAAATEKFLEPIK